MAESESPSPSKSKFSIDNILQQSPVPTSLQWSTPQAAVLQQRISHHVQQQQQQQQQQQNLLHRQERNSQYLVQFLLNAGFKQPFPLVAVSNHHNHHHENLTLTSPAAESTFTLSLPVPPAFTPSAPQAVQDKPKVVGERPKHILSLPPKLLKFNALVPEDSELDVGNPTETDSRRRQSSVNSTGVSNDSDEENSSGMKTLSPQFDGTSRVAHQSSRETIHFKKSRTSFTKVQIQKLEVKFGEQKYLTKLDRTRLAKELKLTEKHVKTWFQNRRTKWKKDCTDVDWSRHKELAATLMYGQHLETKNQISKE